MTIFDRYVAVDWSAKNSPATGKDSIWIADLPAGGEVALSNPSTRRRAAAELGVILDRAANERTLLTVDASLGYPAGSARWFGLDGAVEHDPPWRAMWHALERDVVDDDRNRSNRFEVAAALNRRNGANVGGPDAPFWGRHATNELHGLTVTKPSSFPVSEFRVCDAWLRDNGRHPASPWQLLGVGSVGSQSLTLIPILERLRRARDVDVWPLSTGLRAPATRAGSVVIAEIWPTWFDIEVPIQWIRDAAQVHGVAQRLADADASAELTGWFEPHIAVPDRQGVVAEEGWILGVPGNLQ